MYVDSNVFIRVLIYESGEKTAGARRFLGLVERGEVVAHTSALTWDEVVGVVRSLMGQADASQAGAKLLHFPNLRLVPATEDVLARAQKLVEEFKLAPRDAIHCASALARGIETVVSDDSDIDVVSEIRRVAPGSFKT